MHHLFKHHKKEKTNPEDKTQEEKSTKRTAKKIQPLKITEDPDAVALSITETQLSPSSSSSSPLSQSVTIPRNHASSPLGLIQTTPQTLPPPSPLHPYSKTLGDHKATSLSPNTIFENPPPYLSISEDMNEKTLSRKEKRKSLFLPFFSRNLFPEPESPRKPNMTKKEKSNPLSENSTPRLSTLGKEETKEKKRRVLSREVNMSVTIERDQQPLGSPKMESPKEDSLNNKKQHSKRHSNKKSVDLTGKEKSLVESGNDKMTQKPTRAHGRKDRKKIMSMQISDPSIIFAGNNSSWEPEIKTARSHYRGPNIYRGAVHSASQSREGSLVPKRYTPLHVSQTIFDEAKKDIFLLMSSYSFQNWKLKKVRTNGSIFGKSSNENSASGGNDDDDDDDDDAINDVITLEKVLENPQLSNDFEIYLKSEFSAENIYFYREVERFEKRTFENQLDIDTEALRIYERFLAPGSDLQVNVSSIILGKVHMELFGESIKDESTDSWSRWFIPAEYPPKAVEVANEAAAAAASSRELNISGDNQLLSQQSQLPPQIACLISSPSQPSMVDLTDKQKKRRSIFFRKT